MPDSWATSGLDLHLELRGPRRRAALETALRDAISSGRLPAGVRLPSSRALAADLGLARNTVAEAYAQLVAEGWATAVPGSGTRVAQRPRPRDDHPDPPAPPQPPRFRHDLRPGSPDLSMFPRTAWIAAARRALTTAPDEAFGYGDPCGRIELRQALVAYLARTRGVTASADQIVICGGFAQAFGLVCRLLAARGAATLAVERYLLAETVAIAASAGLSLSPSEVDRNGAVVETFGSAGAALLTPAHQFPLGVALSPERRTQAVDWAIRSEALLIEDDYDGEFRYDRRPVGALQAHAPEHVIYLGTSSKTLAPGVRLGWLVAPRGLLPELTALKRVADRQSGSIEQLTLAELLAGDGYDRHIRRARLSYRRRRDALVAALGDGVPEVGISGIAAGLHVLLRLPPQLPEDDVVEAAAARSLAVGSLGPFALGPGTRPAALVVGYGTPPAHAFGAAVAALVATLRGVVAETEA